MTYMLFVQYYALKIFPRRLAKTICTVYAVLFAVQIFFVLTSRNHYTVDAVVAMYVAPLNFFAQLYFFPHDIKPPLPPETVGRDVQLMSELGTQQLLPV